MAAQIKVEDIGPGRDVTGARQFHEPTSVTNESLQ